jgi:hypothetical protein
MNWVETDRFKAVQTIEYAHASVHTDSLVIASDYDASVSAAKNYLIVAPAHKELHIVVTVTVSEAAVMEIFHGPTISNNGTVATHARMNLYSTKDIKTTYVNPTVSDDGTLLWQGYLAGGSGGGANGGNVRNGQEFVLPASDSMLVRVTPVSANEQVGFEHEYYEVPAGANKP